LTFVAILDGLIFLQFGLLTTIVAHCSYNMIISSVGLFQSSDPYLQFSGLVVLALLFSLLIPGLVVWLRRKMGRATPLLADFELAPATPADLEQLAAFPVKANWPVLLADDRRIILCLRSGEMLLGFSTGFQTGSASANLDGVYIVPKLRRAYWGATLLDYLQAQFKERGVEHFSAQVGAREPQPLAFLKNLFWQTDTLLLKQGQVPVFSFSAVKAALARLRRTRPSPTQPACELEIPRRDDSGSYSAP